MSTAADALNMIANLAIVIGYLLVPAFWLPYLPLTRPVQIAGALFFGTCAITHLWMALAAPHMDWWMVIDHTVQAIAVWWFVLGFSRLLRRASRSAEDNDDL